MSPEDLKKETEEILAKNSIINKLQNKEEISLDIQYNPDYEGEIRINDIIYQFDVQEYSYQGMLYYLPVINGKAKRIKNKTIILTNYEYCPLDDNNVTIIVQVKDFIIKK